MTFALFSLCIAGATEGLISPRTLQRNNFKEALHAITKNSPKSGAGDFIARA